MRVIVVGRACLGRDALIELLRDHGHEPLAAEDLGPAAVDRLRAPACVLVLDHDELTAGELDGWRRSLAARGHAPRWIGLTRRAPSLSPSVDCTLSKPVAVEALLSAVDGA